MKRLTHLFPSIIFLWVLLPSPSVFATEATVPPAAFAKSHHYISVKLSPDGEKLSAVVNHQGNRHLVVFSLPDFNVVGGARLPHPKQIGEHYWVNDERIVMTVLRKRSGYAQLGSYGELVAMDYDSKSYTPIFGFQSGDTSGASRVRKRESIRGWAEIINILPEDENHILISIVRMSDSGGNLAHIQKINVNTGVLRNRKVITPIGYSSTVTDYKGNVRFTVGVDETNTRRSFQYDDGDWSEISGEFSEGFRPLSISDDGQTLFYLDNDKSDKKGLFSLDLQSGQRRNIYTDEKVDITSINFSTDGSSAYALRVDDGYPSYVTFGNAREESKLFKSLLQTFAGYKVNITSRTKDGNLWIVYVSNDVVAGAYYLYDSAKNTLSHLFTNLDHINIALMSQSQPFVFPSFDGKEIPAYITYPVNIQDGEKVPLVTLVHGGPRSRDFWTYDSDVQMLAAQGYAVLRVNFRGSEGYGENFMHAGDHKWGSDIQKDIIAGTEHVIAQGKIDAEKVCIMGASFGGYSAVMSPILAPDLFKCAVAHVGVFDLALMQDQGDIPELLYGKEYVEEAVGTSDEIVKSQSPVHNIKKLKAEVFIAHGKKDRRVPFEHAERLKEAMDEHNKSYEWFVKDSEAHGFFDEANRAEYYERVATFLSKHLH